MCLVTNSLHHPLSPDSPRVYRLVSNMVGTLLFLVRVPSKAVDNKHRQCPKPIFKLGSSTHVGSPILCPPLLREVPMSLPEGLYGWKNQESPSWAYHRAKNLQTTKLFCMREQACTSSPRLCLWLSPPIACWKNLMPHNRATHRQTQTSCSIHCMIAFQASTLLPLVVRSKLTLVAPRSLNLKLLIVVSWLFVV